MKISAYYSVVCLLICVVLCGGMAGCGYSSSSLLPADQNSIHVDNFANGISTTREISDKRNSYSYKPGLENDLTRAVINGFIFDRHLAIETEQKSALLLKGTLTDFRQYPLTYDDDYNIDEFRMEIFIDMELYNNKTGEVLWTEKNFMGQTNYYVTGPNKMTEGAAQNAAIKDLALRVVERTVEAW